MKIRTVDELQTRIDAERIWRIREISALRSQCFIKNDSAAVSKAIRRSFVPIAYAHWEGFVKKSAHYYLEFVAMQGLSLKELNSQFKSMYLMQKCSTNLSLSKSHSLIEVIETVMGESKGAVKINYQDVISTNWSLNSDVLKDICDSLGLNYKQFESKRFFIDVGLIKNRNKIAHGELQDIDEVNLEEIKTQVVDLIGHFKTEIENAAIMNTFRATQKVL
jgi:MAE_28990/MAE_18760-like HEPN